MHDGGAVPKLEPAMLLPHARMTRIDLARIALLALTLMSLIGILIVSAVRIRHTAELTLCNTMFDATSNAASDDNGIVHATAINKFSDVTINNNASNFLRSREQLLAPDPFVSVDLSPELMYVGSPLGDGLLLDLCGSVGIDIDVSNTDSDGTCRRHDADVWCGSFRLSTADEPCGAEVSDHRVGVLQSLDRLFGPSSFPVSRASQKPL